MKTVSRRTLRQVLTSLVVVVGGSVPFAAPEQRPDAQKAENSSYYKRWLDEDVTYIISDEEKSVFQKLATDEEREKFIEEFWRRRDPTPGTLQNEAKEEHYRRIAYANQYFSSGKPGWKNDRGWIYIAFGPPDRKETYPTGTWLQVPEVEGGHKTMVTFPFEVWEYRFIEGIGNEVRIEFVDRFGTNDFNIALDDNEKDALFSITGSQTYRGRFDNTPVLVRDLPFERLDVYHKLNMPPVIKFKKLEEAVAARVTYNQLQIGVQDNYLRLTDDSVQAMIALEIDNNELSYERLQGGDYAGSVNLYGRVVDVAKRVVSVFEDTVRSHLSAREVEKELKGKSMYQKKLILRPGRYIIDGVAEDTQSGKMGTIQKLMVVPQFSEESLSGSSLILASTIQPAGGSPDLQSPFLLGDVRVIPNVYGSFKQGDPIAFYWQAYNLTLDPTSLRPVIEFSVAIHRGDAVVATAPASQLSSNISGQQMTLTGFFQMDELTPGQYSLRIRLTDKISGSDLVAAANLTIR